jgi:hypothetical protein
MSRAGDATEPAKEIVPGRGSLFLRRLIVLYPAAWRRRYSDEFEALLEQTPLTFRTLFDVGVSAVDAHLNPTGPMRKWPFMFERLRSSELAVFAGWILFVVSGLGFAKMTENWDLLPPQGGDTLAVGLAYDAVIVGAVVALLGVLVAGMPIAWAIIRSALRERRWRLIALFAVPPLSLAFWIGLTLLPLNEIVPGQKIDEVTKVAAFAAWVGVFCVAAVASTVAVTVAALNSSIPSELYRRAATPATVVAGTMAVVSACVGIWGLAVLATQPSLFWGKQGLLATSTALSWLGVVVGMAIGTTVALRGAAAARATFKSS